MHRTFLTRLLAPALVGLALIAGCGGEEEETEIDPGALTYSPVVKLYGRSGTFGGLATQTLLPTGQSFGVSSMYSWFGAGQAAFFTAWVDGVLLVGNEPQTDNQTMPTARNMAISTYTPATNSFRNLIVPTSRGKNYVTNPWTTPPNVVGGADVSDLQVVDATTIAFSSSVPFHWWDPTLDGEYPAIGFLRKGTTGWRYDATTSRTANQLRASNPALADQACPMVTSLVGTKYPFCGLAELTLAPASKHFLVSQYFNNPGTRSGGILALDGRGNIVARYQVPDFTSDGKALLVHPREIEADPTGVSGDERFVVIYDVLADGVQQPFAAQEFRYEAAAKRITPRSAPVLMAAGVAFNAMAYDYQGRLWAGGFRAGTLYGAPLVAYNKGSLASRCPASKPWGTVCSADRSFDLSSHGMAMDVTEDPGTHSILVATAAGHVLPLRYKYGYYSLRKAVDLGLGQLVDRYRHSVWPRKGSVDPTGRLYWLPIQHVQTADDCAAYPCAPSTNTSQWLYRISIDDMLR